ncbi:transcriptional regulator, TetR family [Haloterrigena turkmenica DSM 5511]|uniref:Transcriptional regulator, TetR family n=1 Tax=Haloterrigena turkmenica (strain ATCC 51198 / DSM 5511 / JCM 9101 / NCIMB 13204 / VKM B-1734 / 4k) TaxID=543526 RepID=D2RST9_HALTV|nr:TetR/AcrR family transcriptional regulator [Haloterrigena turkmenica]ADB58913.1 transcriptional regulator, TetR family [Haloterrigena turkmenica DSM 5511]
MDAPDPFESASDETRGEMMRATYEALRTHGYSDLTIQRIGDEFPKSKSLIYQHYDGKDDLLVAFLEFLLERFKADVPSDDDFEDARDHLLTLVEQPLAESNDEHVDFVGAMTALRGQAPYDEAYWEQFADTDAFFREHVADIVRDGIEQGVFREVDPEQTAAFISATIDGAQSQHVTTGSEEAVDAVRRELTDYVERRLVVDGEDDS